MTNPASILNVSLKCNFTLKNEMAVILATILMKQVTAALVTAD